MKALLTCAILCLSFFATRAQSFPTLETLTEYMSGSFTSKAQSEADTNYLNIALRMERIWKNDDQVWLYVEQSLNSDPERPYRQRIYRLESLGKGRFVSWVYDLPEKDAYVGAWKKPKMFKSLEPSSLIELSGCNINLIYIAGKEEFIGSIEGKCENSWGKAKWATSEVKIRENQLVSWDRGWDEEGNQVWGAKQGGYIFIKE